MRSRSSEILFLLVLTFIFSSYYYPMNAEGYYPGDIQDDVNNKFTNVGNIAMTITNYGTIGNGFANFPNQPSCQYPINSGIENIFVGGIWVGGSKSGQIRVTTGAIDVSSANRGEGFEFSKCTRTGNSRKIFSAKFSQLQT
ncbi:MAG: hypothetical protein IPM96_17660 [Ignavibacteria bacterium]|nr:hypothetical protein [Ignavibacteria bacterium]